MTDEQIKSFIKRKREEKGLTQQEMADLLGIDRNTYRGIEAGGTRMLNVHMPKISEILGMEVGDLVNGYRLMDVGLQKMTDMVQSYESRLEQEKTQHEEDIAALNARIAHLEQIVTMQSSQLRDKEDIINLLKSRKNQ